MTLALEAVMQNGGYFLGVILLYVHSMNTTLALCSPSVSWYAQLRQRHKQVHIVSVKVGKCAECRKIHSTLKLTCYTSSI
jgi:hypothetical protein